KHQIASADDEHGMYIGVAEGGEPLRYPAQRGVVYEFVLANESDGPAVLPRKRDAAAIGWVREHWHCVERRQRGSAQK
ncbi:hypothetical protein ODX41_20410, partial [Salmonella enterica subsp. enterica serovar Enteritidis]